MLSKLHIRGNLNCKMTNLGPTWDQLGAKLSPKWCQEGPRWSQGGPSWSQVGAKEGQVGGSVGHLGSNLKVLEAIWEVMVENIEKLWVFEGIGGGPRAPRREEQRGSRGICPVLGPYPAQELLSTQLPLPLTSPLDFKHSL